MKLMVTGGCGFIGSNFVRLILEERPDWDVVNFDLLTYAGNAENLADHADNPRYRLVRGDVAEPEQVRAALEGVDAVAHFAAESHVDRSIQDATPFVRANVVGTHVMLEESRKAGIKRFVHISTDEVYGHLGPDDPAFTEAPPLAPRNPYSATKAGAACRALAAFETHGLPVMITRCPNNYGPWHFPEKFIPLVILNAMADKQLPVYGDGMQVRDWIHVTDHNRAALRVLEDGTPGQVYHVGAECERFNIDVVKIILKHLETYQFRLPIPEQLAELMSRGHLDRTNNFEESIFRDIKRGQRRQVGKKDISREFSFHGPYLPLMRNLTNDHYVATVIGRIEDLPLRISELNPREIDHYIQKLGENRRGKFFEYLKDIDAIELLPARP